MNLALALAGAVPALVAMFYVDKLDAARPEPRWSLRKMSIAGGIAVIPCAVIELGLQGGFKLGPLGTAFFSAFIVAAGVEELAKALCLRWLIWHRPEFDERMDGIVYATRAGLGFALVENVLYLAGTSTPSGYLGMFVGRAVLSVPLHAICAGIMGYYAARQRFDRTGPGILGGYVIAVLMHGTYDGALFSMPVLVQMTGSPAIAIPLLATAIGVVAVGGFFLRGMARRAVALDDAAERRAAMEMIA